MRSPTERMDRFLRLMNEKGASDLHLVVGLPPMLRSSGDIVPIRFKDISEYDWENLVRPITPKHLWDEYKRSGDIDFAYEAAGIARFRVNLFRQQRGAGAVLRVIPTRIMSVDQLGLPPAIKKLASFDSGLVLITGPTGSGKSTTLAGIIDMINDSRKMHIITIEDPIEFVHRSKKSLVHQREVGAHATSFSEALKAAVREDPNLILVGEMRDLTTIQLALQAAEKGLLVFGTLHTNNAAKTVDRIVSVFPAQEQEAVRTLVGEVTQAIIAQQLCRREGGGRVAALEILFGSGALASLIRQGKTTQVTSLIQTGKREGMITMDAALLALLEKKVISPITAFEKAIDKDAFKDALAKAGGEEASLIG